MKKLYVGNLPFQTTEGDLTNMFEPHGNIKSVQIITDRDTGRSKGFAFVGMTDDDGVEKAIAALNGQPFGGRSLTVDQARPMVKRDFGSQDRGGPAQQRRDRY